MKPLTTIIGTIAATGTLLSAGIAQAKDEWAQFMQAYHLAEQRTTLRLEGGSTLADRLGVYGFVDGDATEEKPADVENFYAEARLNQNLGNVAPVLKHFGFATEYNCGNGLEDIVRLGLTFSPSDSADVAQGNIIFAKFYPVETSGDRGMQLSVFASRSLPHGFSISGLVDYNITAGNAYAEQELGYRANKHLSAIGQIRVSLAEGEKPFVGPVVGVRYAF